MYPHSQNVYFLSTMLQEVWHNIWQFVYWICFFLRMIRSSFKAENLVIMQVLTTSSCWPETYNLSVYCILYTVERHYALHFMSLNPEYFFISTLFSCFIPEFTNTSPVVQKSLNKSFQTSYTFSGDSKYQTLDDVVYPQFKSRNKHSSTLSLKDRELSLGCI